MHFSSVVLPEPLWPIRPSDDPSWTSNATSRSAQKSSARMRPESRRCLSELGRSRNSRKTLETSSTSSAARSQLLREVAGETEESRHVKRSRSDGPASTRPMTPTSHAMLTSGQDAEVRRATPWRTAPAGTPRRSA